MGSLICNICGNVKGNHVFAAKEKMLGTLEEFEYVVCSSCGHVHLATIPDNLDRWYPGNYYSYRVRPLPRWWRWLHRARTIVMFGGGNLFDRMLLSLKSPWYGRWLTAMGLKIGDRFLDVGCGAGNFIRELQAAGLSCTGIDPFLPEDEDTPEGVRLRRRGIETEDGTYKGILFSHSLEHVPDPAVNLRCARKCLAPGGRLALRIPLADSIAFWRYGPDWFQLDAPRHLNLFTQKSLSILALNCGLSIISTWHDSYKEQFWISEEYRMGICMNNPHSYAHDSHQTHFSKEDMARFDRWTKWANEMGVGDQATFLLQSSSELPTASS